MNLSNVVIGQRMNVRLSYLVLILGLTSTAASREPVTIYAAASLSSAIEELRTTANRQGQNWRFSFGGSSSLARQIEQGAPADIYLSANIRWMNYLEEQDLVEPGTRRDFLGNELVIVAPKRERIAVHPEKGFDFAGSFEGRLALADPDHVPAGIYAKEALKTLGWWGALANRLAPAPDVRAALVFVERGECSAGIVYATDAVVNPNLIAVAHLPPQSHAPIVYPIAIVRDRSTADVQAAYDLLTSQTSTFTRHGFSVLTTIMDGTQ